MVGERKLGRRGEERRCVNLLTLYNGHKELQKVAAEPGQRGALGSTRAGTWPGGGTEHSCRTCAQPGC